MTDDCIVPQNATNDIEGYPRLRWNKRIWRMNRMMWTIVNGDIPQDTVVAHHCNNKGCINTNHMYLCSHHQNSSDAARDELYRSGLDHPRSKVTPEIADEMSRLYHDMNVTQASIGVMYGFSQSQVSSIIRKRKYDPLTTRTTHNSQNL